MHAHPQCFRTRRYKRNQTARTRRRERAAQQPTAVAGRCSTAPVVTKGGGVTSAVRSSRLRLCALDAPLSCATRQQPWPLPPPARGAYRSAATHTRTPPGGWHKAGRRCSPRLSLPCGETSSPAPRSRRGLHQASVQDMRIDVRNLLPRSPPRWHARGRRNSTDAAHAHPLP